MTSSALDLKARFLLMKDAVGEAAASLRACVVSSPSATDCLHDLAALDRNEGNCSALEATCRAIMARVPQSSNGYDCLADALYSTGGPPDSFRSAYASRHARLHDAKTRSVVEAFDDAYLAIAAGSLSEADSLLARIDRTAIDVSRRVELFSLRVRLNIELGKLAKAQKLANEFSDDAKAWPRSDFADTAAVELSLKSMTGILTPEERASTRRRLEENAVLPGYGTPFRKWFNIDVMSVVSANDARFAASLTPTQMLAAQYRSPLQDYAIGHMYALAGDHDSAIRFLKRAGRSCGLRDTVYRQPALVELASESELDTRDRCEALEMALATWRSAPNCSTLHSARQMFSSLHCNATDASGGKTPVAP